MKIHLIAASSLACLGLFLATAPGAPAAPLDVWSWRHPLPQGNDLLGVGGGDGKIVVVGKKGAKGVSADGGVTWQSVPENTLTTYGVAYGAGLFVAVGEGASTGDVIVQTSPDGFHWSDQTIHSTNLVGLTDVVFGKGQFIAVGGSRVILVSSNGVDWQEWDTGLGYGLAKIKFDGKQFLGVGYLVAASSDGKSWSDFLHFGTDDIAESSTGIYVWGSSWTYYDHDHGVTYAEVMAGTVKTNTWSMKLDIIRKEVTDNVAAAVAYGNGTFVLAGTADHAVLYSSTDGVTWHDHSAAAPDNLYGVAFVGDRFVAVGNHGTILTSLDGWTWSPANATSPRNFRSLTYGLGLHVAVGNEGLLMTSPDGVAWTDRPIPTTNNLRGVTYKDGLFVAVGEPDEIGATMLVSSNGLSWRRWSLNTTNGLYDIAVSTNQFMAVGDNGEVQTSLDGVYWFSHQITNQVGTPFAWPVVPRLNSVAWGGGLFVAVGEYGSILTSADGRDWTLHTPTDVWQFYQGVAYGNGTFVVMGHSGSLVVSSNGVDWVPQVRPTSRDVEDIFFAQGQFVAVGEKGYVGTSSNGLTWTQHEAHCQNDLRGVAYQGSHFIAVGNNATILQSGFLGPAMLRARGSLGAEGFELAVTGELGRTYQVQGSDDLETWEDLMLFTNQEETTLFLDMDAAGWGRRFYRVVAP